MEKEDYSIEFVHSATFLPLEAWHYTIPFLRMSSKVMKQAKSSEGIVDYAVKGDFPKKHFWTLSIWMSRESMRRFVMSEPHTTAIKKFEKWAGEGAAFVEWTNQMNSIDWTEAMKRLENPTFYYTKGQKRRNPKTGSAVS